MKNIRSFKVGTCINIGDATIRVIDGDGDNRGNYVMFSSSRHPYMSWAVYESEIDAQKSIDIGLLRVVTGTHFWASMLCGIIGGWDLDDNHLFAEGGGSINLTNGEVVILGERSVFTGNFIADVIGTTKYMPSTFTHTDAGSLLTAKIMMELKTLGYRDVFPVACNLYEATRRKKFRILNVKIVDDVVSVD